jgi:hypothetical protein
LSKGRAYLSSAPLQTHALTKNIKLVCKGLSWRNTLAYFALALITKTQYKVEHLPLADRSNLLLYLFVRAEPNFQVLHLHSSLFCRGTSDEEKSVKTLKLGAQQPRLRPPEVSPPSPGVYV